jgi:hypothetical protein
MSIEFFSAALGAVPAILSLPGTAELAFLTSGTLLSRRTAASPPPDTPPLRLCVVMPAHDEAAGIADNCADHTARLAAAGARVLERHDAERRGKGHALDHAFAPLYILWKLTLDGKLLAFAKRNAPWVRTEREN